MYYNSEHKSHSWVPSWVWLAVNRPYKNRYYDNRYTNIFHKIYCLVLHITAWLGVWARFDRTTATERRTNWRTYNPFMSLQLLLFIIIRIVCLLLSVYVIGLESTNRVTAAATAGRTVGKGFLVYSVFLFSINFNCSFMCSIGGHETRSAPLGCRAGSSQKRGTSSIDRQTDIATYKNATLKTGDGSQKLTISIILLYFALIAFFIFIRWRVCGPVPRPMRVPGAQRHLNKDIGY